MLISRKNEIARSVRRPKSQGPCAEDALVESYLVQKFVMFWLQPITNETTRHNAYSRNPRRESTSSLLYTHIFTKLTNPCVTAPPASQPQLLRHEYPWPVKHPQWPRTPAGRSPRRGRGHFPQVRAKVAEAVSWKKLRITLEPLFRSSSIRAWVSATPAERSQLWSQLNWSSVSFFSAHVLSKFANSSAKVSTYFDACWFNSWTLSFASYCTSFPDYSSSRTACLWYARDHPK